MRRVVDCFSRLLLRTVRNGKTLLLLRILVVPFLVVLLVLKFDLRSSLFENADFSKANDELSLQLTTLKRVWPHFQGYKDVASTEWWFPNDPLLLWRIEISQSNIRTSLFKIKKNGLVQERHPWKLEKVIHQTWKSEKIPELTVQWVKKWLEINSDWTYVFWTDDSSRELVKVYYPSLLPVYDSWELPVQRADMIRLLVLYTFGGVFADIDVEPLKPLNEIRDWSSCILSREPQIQSMVMREDLNSWANNWTFSCNAFMACRSHHPFLHYLIGRLTYRSPLVAKGPCPLEETLLCTGPVLVSLAFGYYRRSVDENVRRQRPETNVICPKSEYFLPTFDKTREDLVERQCSKVLTPKQNEICDIWRQRGRTNEPMNYSLTNHHWFHSYIYNVSKSQVNIRNVTEVIVWTAKDETEHFEVTYEGP